MTIKELRKQQKLTQTEFARALGISPGAVSLLETGRMKVSAKLRWMIVHRMMKPGEYKIRKDDLSNCFFHSSGFSG